MEYRIVLLAELLLFSVFKCFVSGKCLGSRRETHKLHEVFSHSLSLLNSKAPFGHTYPPVQLAFSLDLVGKEIPGDVFAIERATTLYNISWFALKGYRSKETRYPEALCVCVFILSVSLSPSFDCLLLFFLFIHSVYPDPFVVNWLAFQYKTLYLG